MIDKIKMLIKFLNLKRPSCGPYRYEETSKYYRIVGSPNNKYDSVYCFIVKNDFENKSIGNVKSGDFLYPSTWSQPAKHPRGNLNDYLSWDGAFGKWGMNTLI